MSKPPNSSDLTALVLRGAEKAGLLETLLHAPLVVGVSGGADSLALLHFLCRLRGESAAQTLHVAHLDHGFRGEAGAEDARFVAAVAGAWELPFTVRSYDVPAFAQAHRLSLEDAARRVRYAFLAGIAHSVGGTVTVAHNADDQAETVLMHLLRGSGLGGLAGMRPLSRVPVGSKDIELATLLSGYKEATVPVFRPLLTVPRVLVEQYCAQEALEPLTDASNYDLAYSRNKVRHELLPTLQQAFPAVKLHLGNLANIAAAEDDMIETSVEQEWQRRVTFEPSGEQVTFTLAGFTSLPLAMQRRVVRKAVRSVAGTYKDLSLVGVEDALVVLTEQDGGPAAVDLPHGVRIERQGDVAHVSARTRTGADFVATAWPNSNGSDMLLQKPVVVGARISLSADWELRATIVAQQEEQAKPGDYVALFDRDVVQQMGGMVVRTWQEGDRIQPFGMKGHKSLQDLFVDAKIPRRARNSIAIIALASPHTGVLWVPGPGGRRSALAPVTETTTQTLALQFVKLGPE